MSNDIRSRRLIVTLPDTASEEIDEIAADVEQRVRAWPEARTASVQHALDDAPLDRWKIDASVYGRVSLVRPNAHEYGRGLLLDHLAPEEARKLAALILRAADEAEGRG